MALKQHAAGRWVGGLMHFQLVAGAMTMLVLTAPLFESDGYLAVAAALQPRLGLSILLTLAGTVVAIAVAVLMFMTLRSHGPALALGLLMLTAVGAALSAVNFALLAPLGLAQLLNGGWLLARGFRPAAA